MSQVRSAVRKRKSKRAPVTIGFADLGYGKVAVLKYRITMRDIEKYIQDKIKWYEKEIAKMEAEAEKLRRQGKKPWFTTKYAKENLAELKEVYAKLKKMKSTKEKWDYLTWPHDSLPYTVPLWVRALVFDKYDFPVVSKLVGHEVVDLDEGTKEFMTESDSRIIRYWDKDERVYSVFVQWEPKTDKPPLEGTIKFFYEPGYEGGE